MRTEAAVNLKTTYWDVVLGAGLLLCSIFLLFVVMKSTWFPFESSQWIRKAPVGTLQREAGWVRLRPSRSVIWRDLGGDIAAVQAGDVIFTGVDGNATLSFFSGEKVKLFPNSILVVESRSNLAHETLINALLGWFFNAGSHFDLTLEKGRTQMTLSNAGTAVKIRGTENSFEIQAIKALAEFEVQISDELSGALKMNRATGAEVSEIRRQKEPVQVKKTEAVFQKPAAPVVAPNLSPLKVPKKDLLLPYVEADRVSASTELLDISRLENLVIRLRWKKLIGVKKYEVNIFRPDGSIQKKSETQVPLYEFQLTSLRSTRFSYEVTAFLNSGEVIKTKRIPIAVHMSSPEPVHPEDNWVFGISKKVLFTWKKTSLTRYYRLQIAADSTFKKVMADQFLTNNFFQWKGSKPGKLYWRVKSLSEGGLSSWSGVRRLQLKANPK